ncbi:MAG: hypothetical protein JO250_07230 [Armatimonadetes bacterium]|nr:hypothetical protein [Armatimonadota bacterium]
MMDEDIPFVDQGSLIRYIRTALTMDGIEVGPDLIGRVLELELEYLQHQGIAEQVVDDPRPER